MDEYISTIIAHSKVQIEYLAESIMHWIHDIFPADVDDSNNPIFLKKLTKHDSTFMLGKDLLGFEFDGAPSQLKATKWTDLLDLLQQQIHGSRTAKNKRNPLQ